MTGSPVWMWIGIASVIAWRLCLSRPGEVRKVDDRLRRLAPRHQSRRVKNQIKMADLRACFEADGFAGASTYIQSGNVVFVSRDTGLPGLVTRIERMLAANFDYEASVVVRNRTQMRAIVDRSPKGFGSDPSSYRSDVIFLKPPLTARTAMKSVRTREGVDPGVCGDRGALLLTPHQPGVAESAQPARRLCPSTKA